MKGGRCREVPGEADPLTGSGEKLWFFSHFQSCLQAASSPLPTSPVCQGLPSTEHGPSLPGHTASLGLSSPEPGPTTQPAAWWCRLRPGPQQPPRGTCVTPNPHPGCTGNGALALDGPWAPLRPHSEGGLPLTPECSFLGPGHRCPSGGQGPVSSACRSLLTGPKGISQQVSNSACRESQ